MEVRYKYLSGQPDCLVCTSNYAQLFTNLLLNCTFEQKYVQIPMDFNDIIRKEMLFSCNLMNTSLVELATFVETLCLPASGAMF